MIGSIDNSKEKYKDYLGRVYNDVRCPYPNEDSPTGTCNALLFQHRVMGACRIRIKCRNCAKIVLLEYRPVSRSNGLSSEYNQEK